MRFYHNFLYGGSCYPFVIIPKLIKGPKNWAWTRTARTGDPALSRRGTIPWTEAYQDAEERGTSLPTAEEIALFAAHGGEKYLGRFTLTDTVAAYTIRTSMPVVIFLDGLGTEFPGTSDGDERPVITWRVPREELEERVAEVYHTRSSPLDRKRAYLAKETSHSCEVRRHPIAMALLHTATNDVASALLERKMGSPVGDLHIDLCTDQWEMQEDQFVLRRVGYSSGFGFSCHCPYEYTGDA
jgi:hypothetical protein